MTMTPTVTTTTTPGGAIFRRDEAGNLLEYIAPDNLASLANGLPSSAVADQFSDMRVAEYFAKMFGDRVRYWPEAGKFLTFNGKIWTTDAAGGAYPLVRAMIERLYRWAIDSPDYAARQDMFKAIAKLEAHPRQTTILEAVAKIPELIVTAANLDQNPMLLAVENGTLNLETFDLQPHSASDFITRKVNVRFNPLAQCPRWLAFLDRILAGNQELISYLRRWFGYCLTGRTGEQVLLFLYGTGANGKSVLANILDALLAEFARTAGSDLLMIRADRNASNDVAALRGARLVKVSEFDEGARLAEAQIKTLTGGDPVTCRHLYREFFTYVPCFKILLLGNHKPKVTGTDNGIWRRLHLLHFGVTIPPEERDPYLQDKLLAELPGILRWAAEGCCEWQRTGLNPPDEIKAATDEYRQSEDVFDEWLQECCSRGEWSTASAADLLKSFAEYSGWRNVSPQKLGRLLSAANFTREKSNGVIFWRGLALVAT